MDTSTVSVQIGRVASFTQDISVIEEVREGTVQYTVCGPVSGALRFIDTIFQKYEPCDFNTTTISRKMSQGVLTSVITRNISKS